MLGLLISTYYEAYLILLEVSVLTELIGKYLYIVQDLIPPGLLFYTDIPGPYLLVAAYMGFYYLFELTAYGVLKVFAVVRRSRGKILSIVSLLISWVFSRRESLDLIASMDHGGEYGSSLYLPPSAGTKSFLVRRLFVRIR